MIKVDLIPFFLLLLFIFSVLSVFILRGRDFVTKLISPAGFFIVYHSFVFYLVPYMQLTFKVGRFPHLYLDDNFYFLFSTLFALVYQVLVVSVFIFLGNPVLKFDVLARAARRHDASSSVAILFLFTMVIVGSYVIGKLLILYADSYSDFMFDRINILSGYGYFTKMIAFSTPLVILLFCKKQGRLLSVSIFMVITCSFLMSMLLGSRTQAVIAIPYLLLAYLFFDPAKRMRAKVLIKLALLFLFLITVMAALSVVRDTIKGGHGVSLESLDEESEGGLALRAVSELHVNYGHNELLALAIERGDEYQSALGGTIFAGLVSFVPRSLWSEKPVGAGPMMANIVSPGAYSLGDKKGNSSLTTGMVLEGYLNFKLAGVLMFALVHSVSILLLTHYSSRVKNSIDFVVFLISLHYLSIVFVTGEFLGVFSAYIFSVVPLVMISKFFKIFASNNSQFVNAN